jgi:predicted DNA-binding protein
MDMRNIVQSQAFHDIQQDLQRWQVSPEGQDYMREVNEFNHTPEGLRLAKEIQEALDTLKKNSHELPDGIEIDNDAIPQIQKEFNDVKEAIDATKNSNSGNELQQSAQRAIQQKDFQSALRKLDQLGKSEMGKELADDIDDLGEKLDKYVKVEDVPESIKAQMH